MTEAREKHCVGQRTRLKVEGEFIFMIDKTVQKVEIVMGIEDATDRVYSMHQDYTQVLSVARYTRLRVINLISPKLIMEILKLAWLNARIEDISRWRKGEDFHKNDLVRS